MSQTKNVAAIAPNCQVSLIKGGAFSLTVGVFLLTIELLCLQSLEALVRCTFPL